MSANANIVVHPSQDIWALGIIGFESVVGRVTLTTVGEMGDCASGRKSYPWELAPELQPPVWRQSRLRNLLLPCLAREPARRPTAAQFVAAAARMGHATTMQGP